MTFEKINFQIIVLICLVLQTFGISFFNYYSIEYSIVSLIIYALVSYWFFVNTRKHKSKSKNFILLSNFFLMLFPFLNFNSYDFRILQVADVGMILILVCFAIYHFESKRAK